MAVPAAAAVEFWTAMAGRHVPPFELQNAPHDVGLRGLTSTNATPFSV